MKKILVLGMMAGLMMSCGEERKESHAKAVDATCSDEYVASHSNLAKLAKEIQDIRANLSKDPYNGYNGKTPQELEFSRDQVQFKLFKALRTFKKSFADASSCLVKDGGMTLVHKDEINSFEELIAEEDMVTSK